MKSILVLCTLATLCHGQGYNYNAPKQSFGGISQGAGLAQSLGSSAGLVQSLGSSAGLGQVKQQQQSSFGVGGSSLGLGGGSGLGSSSFGSGGSSSFGSAGFGGANLGSSSSSSFGSSAGLAQSIGGQSSFGGYTGGGYSAPQQQLAPIVHKHVYVHVAPEEPEEQRFRAAPAVAAPTKHYKIIFVKAPSPPAYVNPVIPVQPQNEEKTLVYVLVKRPDEQADVVIPTAAPTQPSKPEVYFIKYKTQKTQVANKVQDALDVRSQGEIESLGNKVGGGGSPAPKYGPPGYQN